MAHGALPSPDSGRNKPATATNSPMPDSYWERMKGVHKSRSSSRGGGWGEYLTMVAQPSFKPGFSYVSPLRSLYSTAPPWAYSIGSKGDPAASVGALESDLVSKAGQGWRLLTTPSLHAGMFHLAGNLAGLFYVGLQLERQFEFSKV